MFDRFMFFLSNLFIQKLAQNEFGFVAKRLKVRFAAKRMFEVLS